MKRRIVEVGFVLAIVVVAAASGAMSRSPSAPEQPIDFHHRDHVRTDGLSCELCHSGVRRAAFAGMPPVERCMGCHRVVLPENPGVSALRRYWESGKPIPWVKVYSLPRFVRFSHEAHTLAKVDCTHCHGDVASATHIARVTPLTMGWCVDCHRATRAPQDCLTCHY
jgi:Cytochrome c7 and related cytochrome c